MSSGLSASRSWLIAISFQGLAPPQAPPTHGKSPRYDFRITMVRQLEMKRRKEEIIMEKKLQNALEEYIDALYLFNRYNSKRCWREKMIALENYLGLRRKSARLAAVKVRFLGDYSLFVYFNIR